MAKNMQTMDGNTAAAHVSYAFTEVAAIYPITPSSVMAEHVDEWSANGRKNIFDQTVKVVEMQSEAGAAGAVHGSLISGALTTTYTASQGLLLMVPNMYKIAGELLPGVFHVTARAIAGHALSIFGDHSDVMATRQTGFALLSSNSVQEAMDLAAVTHLSAIKGHVPFVHFFDGFRTSHEIQKIDVLDYSDLEKLVDYDELEKYRKGSLNPERPVIRGTAQNPDIFFQAKEVSNPYYTALPEIVDGYMQDINKITGRDYQLFNYYGAEDADRIIIAMGSVCETAEEVVDYLMAKGEKVGLLKVRLFRPFSLKHFLNAVPKTVKKIAAIDRTKEPGALGDPLYEDVCTAFVDQENIPEIIAGRYGLGSKDVKPAQIFSIYENLKKSEPKNHFTVGIVDDVSNSSLEDVNPDVDLSQEGTISCKFWGLGSDGTVGANQNSIKIIGDNTDMYAQAYFSYDSKKSGGITQSHLRFGKEPIRSTYLVSMANFVACHNQAYVYKYDMLKDLKNGGTFLMNTSWSEDEIKANLPAKMKNILLDRDIKFYTVNATKIANEIGLGNRTNTVLQSAFFKLADIIPMEEAIKHMKDAISDTYGRQGDKIINMNNEAVDRGIDNIVEIKIDDSWRTKEEAVKDNTKDLPDFIKNVVLPINAQEGDNLPVSTFVGREGGQWDQGTAKYEKRGIAVNVPEWEKENCIQCNQCAYVCPHAAIRPFLLDEEEAKNAPKSFETLDGKGKGVDEYKFRIQVSTLDCTGCGNCVQVCPAKEKAIVLKSAIEQQKVQVPNWDYAVTIKEKENPMNKNTVKGSQFQTPLLEFSGACAGCGETPYTKLITQLYGDRMMLANATGCSSIWGASAPATPYTKNQKGQGPAWANSLFEDNAEYGYGMLVATKQLREGIKTKLEHLLELSVSDDIKKASQNWLDNMLKGDESKEASKNLISSLEGVTGEAKEVADFVLANKEHLVKKSQWIFGGDGWGYDIGYGGLDHVLASGEDLNILVLDTEVYSNTGGQSSKATPTGAVAQFAASGKKIRKKDLGMMAMSYGYVYVAQVGMGASQKQFIDAVTEAEAYPGPSLIIAYSPCINHGINIGMGATQEQTKRAVDSGYWHLYRYNPELIKEGENPFKLDSKEPSASFRDFIESEVRYTSLQRAFPEIADELFDMAEEHAKIRLDSYKRLEQQEY